MDPTRPSGASGRLSRGGRPGQARGDPRDPGNGPRRGLRPLHSVPPRVPRDLLRAFPAHLEVRSDSRVAAGPGPSGVLPDGRGAQERFPRSDVFWSGVGANRRSPCRSERIRVRSDLHPERMGPDVRANPRGGQERDFASRPRPPKGRRGPFRRALPLIRFERFAARSSCFPRPAEELKPRAS